MTSSRFVDRGFVLVEPSRAALLAGRLLERAVASEGAVWPAELVGEVRALSVALVAAGQAAVVAESGQRSAPGADMGASSERVVSIAEAAVVLGVSERTARRLLAGCGRMVGRQRLVSVADVEAVADERKVCAGG